MRILRAANIAFQPISLGCNTDGWPRLEELSIPFNVDYMVSAGHTDLVIEQLTKSSENLKLLDIRGSPSITPRGLVKIPAWSLKHLSISNCPKMQDETLGMVFQKVRIKIESFFSFLFHKFSILSFHKFNSGIDH